MTMAALKLSAKQHQPLSRVFLWTAPRCMSSAFERSVRELQGVKVFYEPHQPPFYYQYFGPERKQMEYDINDEAHASFQTYETIDRMLLDDYEGHSAVFAKDMAYYIPEERFSVYVEGEFSSFRHSFLIRDPRKAIPSEWRSYVRYGFDFHKEPGFTESFTKLYNLFQFVKKAGKTVTVVDSADLIKNPEYIMERYCQECGLPYDKKMLTWTPGEVEDWTSFKYYKEFHWNAIYTSGFGTKATVQKPSDTTFSDEAPLPVEVEQKVQEALPFYEAMLDYCIRE